MVQQEDGLTEYAAVGSMDLAKAGKAIVKKLYKEHAEVAAMSADQVGDGGGDRAWPHMCTACTGVCSSRAA